MIEYGLFNDEGCLERQLYTPEDIAAAMSVYEPEDDVRVEEMCPDHDEQPRNGCEDCAAEEADEDDTEDEDAPEQQ